MAFFSMRAIFAFGAFASGGMILTGCGKDDGNQEAKEAVQHEGDLDGRVVNPKGGEVKGEPANQGKSVAGDGMTKQSVSSGERGTLDLENSAEKEAGLGGETDISTTSSDEEGDDFEGDLALELGEEPNSGDESEESQCVEILASDLEKINTRHAGTLNDWLGNGNVIEQPWMGEVLSYYKEMLGLLTGDAEFDLSRLNENLNLNQNQRFKTLAIRATDVSVLRISFSQMQNAASKFFKQLTKACSPEVVIFTMLYEDAVKSEMFKPGRCLLAVLHDGISAVGDKIPAVGDKIPAVGDTSDSLQTLWTTYQEGIAKFVEPHLRKIPVVDEDGQEVPFLDPELPIVTLTFGRTRWSRKKENQVDWDWVPIWYQKNQVDWDWYFKIFTTFERDEPLQYHLLNADEIIRLNAQYADFVSGASPYFEIAVVEGTVSMNWQSKYMEYITGMLDVVSEGLGRRLWDKEMQRWKVLSADDREIVRADFKKCKILADELEKIKTSFVEFHHNVSDFFRGFVENFELNEQSRGHTGRDEDQRELANRRDQGIPGATGETKTIDFCGMSTTWRKEIQRGVSRFVQPLFDSIEVVDDHGQVDERVGGSVLPVALGRPISRFVQPLFDSIEVVDDHGQVDESVGGPVLPVALGRPIQSGWEWYRGFEKHGVFWLEDKLDADRLIEIHTILAEQMAGQPDVSDSNSVLDPRISPVPALKKYFRDLAGVVHIRVRSENVCSKTDREFVSGGHQAPQSLLYIRESDLPAITAAVLEFQTAASKMFKLMIEPVEMTVDFDPEKAKEISTWKTKKDGNGGGVKEAPWSELKELFREARDFDDQRPAKVNENKEEIDRLWVLDGATKGETEIDLKPFDLEKFQEFCKTTKSFLRQWSYRGAVLGRSKSSPKNKSNLKLHFKSSDFESGDEAWDDLRDLMKNFVQPILDNVKILNDQGQEVPDVEQPLKAWFGETLTFAAEDGQETTCDWQWYQPLRDQNIF